MTETNDAFDAPKWDEALAGLIGDEYAKKQTPLTIDDFAALARRYSIRFDDIMETVFKLCIHDVWSYQTADGTAQKITQDMVDRLYVNARLYEKDVREFTGGWTPVDK